MLFDDLEATYGDGEVKYILTHRLNNENLFSQIRTKGIDDSPYMVVWIARKLHYEFPYMGDYTYKLANQQPYSASLTNSCSFVNELSLGVLTKPKQKWLEETRTMEKYLFHTMELRSKEMLTTPALGQK
ncbi:unnamed protein product [Diamesa tonsa]